MNESASPDAYRNRWLAMVAGFVLVIILSATVPPLSAKRQSIPASPALQSSLDERSNNSAEEEWSDATEIRSVHK